MNEQDHQQETTEQTLRDAWHRPEIRRMKAGEAESSATGINVDGGFS